MSPGPGYALPGMQRCPKGHENPAGRQYCQECGLRIAPPSDRSPHTTPEDPLQEEMRRLETALKIAHDQKKYLELEVEALRNALKDANANVSPATAAFVAELQNKLRDAEQNHLDAEPELLELKQRAELL